MKVDTQCAASSVARRQWVVLVGVLLYVGFNADDPDYRSCCS
jgi:hypothetical protein